jgi:hypothetical protein
MKTIQWQNKISGAILVILLLFGTAIVLSTTAQAQNPNDPYTQDRNRNDNDDQNRRGRNWDRYGNYGGSDELRQAALNAGYNEGTNEGQRDRETGQFTNLRKQSGYRTAMKGYYPRLGDRELYRRYFREAFEDGYNAERYAQVFDLDGDRGQRNNGNRDRRGRNRDGYGNFGGSFQLRQTALNAGFNEGTRQGRSDLNKRKGTGYQNQSIYVNASKDYSSKLGDRQVYQRYFREAYEHGYSDGYGGY